MRLTTHHSPTRWLVQPELQMVFRLMTKTPPLPRDPNPGSPAAHSDSAEAGKFPSHSGADGKAPLACLGIGGQVASARRHGDRFPAGSAKG